MSIIEIYDMNDPKEVIIKKCKKFMIENPDDSFDTKSLTLHAILSESGRVYATCDEGDQCCSFDWDSVDDFLNDYLLHPKQTV